MKTNKSLPKPLILAASVLVWCGLNLHAQPVITNQPASLTNAPGTAANFSVAVNGTGPFTYQWQFNGAALPNNIITGVAGGYVSYSYSGDGGPATNAGLNYPSGVAFDVFGNMFIADRINNRIRKVNANGIITTVAGGGHAYPGNGGAATNTSLYWPYGVACDAYGNLFIADTYDSRILKVATNGILATVAGKSGNSYSGDGGAATNANLNNPSGVACDAYGNLYIADAGNNRIRKVATNGIITTVAGNGSMSFSGDGGAATNASLNFPIGLACDAYGNLYIADTYNTCIRKVDTNGIISTVAGKGVSGYFSGDGGPATNASLDLPFGVACDAYGNLFIADTDNERIRKVDSNGIISTVAGNSGNWYPGCGNGGPATNAFLNHPTGVAFDASGNLYIADYDLNGIREVFLYAGYPTLILGNIGAINAGNYSVVITSSYGSVTSAVATLTVAAPAIITGQPASQIVGVGSSPNFSVAVAGSGPFGYELYFAGTNLVQSGTNSTLTLTSVSTNNTGNYTVVVTNSYGSVTSHVATLTVMLPPSVTIQPISQTNLPGTPVSFGVTVAGVGPFTYQWLFNGTNFQNNIITTVAGKNSVGYSGDGGPATNASLNSPSGVAFDAFGNLYIADQTNNRIRKVDTNGNITTVAGKSFSGYSGDGGPATNAYLYLPSGVAFNASGNLYIADQKNNLIRKVATNGIITTVAGGGTPTYPSIGDGGAATNASLSVPTGVTFDAFGNMYIADRYNGRIRKVDTAGNIITVAGKSLGYSGDGGIATNATLALPFGVAFDAFGNLYIADSSNQRIRKVDTNGIITTVAGKNGSGYSGDGVAATNATLSFPSGVACDAFDNLYIADRNNNRIREVDSNGIITTVAGNGSSGYSGDGSAATNASLNLPIGVAFDASGNLYIADFFNSRIREVDFAGCPSFSLNNVGITNAGNYTVVITSSYGSVTSAVATLTVTIPRTPPQIIGSGASFGFATNQFGFNISGAFGQTIVVDGSTNLVDWTPLFTNTADNNPFYFLDTASTNFPWRFYRARLP
jgi:sugar lactone lactonase YvrE